jgi:hypothetical protein
MKGRASLLLGSIGLAMLLSATTPAPILASTGSLSPAAKTVTACVQQRRSLLVDFEIDRSGSLKSSDPDDRRVDGVSAALIGLEERTKRNGAAPPVRVQVLLGSFAGDVAPKHAAGKWTVLTKDSLDGLLKQADEYGYRDNGRDTDYVLALDAARRALDARAAKLEEKYGQTPCKVLIFLSDGRFELGDRTGSKLRGTVFYAKGVNLYKAGSGPAAVRMGERYLCSTGGLMDRMADDDIVKFTVALSSTRGFTRANRGFLEAMTTGHGYGVRCGSALSKKTGEFVEARDSRELLFVLGSIGEPTVHRPCSKARPCPNPNQFTAIPGLAGFKLTASALPGVELSLAGPSGSALTLSGEGDPVVHLSGASVHQHWIRSRSLSVDADFDSAGHSWLGDWRFRFFVPGEPQAPVPIYSFSLEPDLKPHVVGEPDLIKGRHTPVELELVDHEGTPVKAGALVRAARMRASVIDGSGASRRAAVRETAPGRFTVPIRVPTETPSGDWALEVETTFRDGGTPIEPSFVSLPLPAPAIENQSGGVPALALLALAVLILGLALVYWRRRAQASFVAPLHLRVLACRAIVAPGGGVELDPDPGRPTYEDFKQLKRTEAHSGGRRIERGDLTLRARLRGLGHPFGEASADGRELIGGGVDGLLPSGEKRTRLRVPLDLAGSWLFLVDSIDEDDRVHGQLFVFIAEEDAARGPAVLAGAREALAAQDWTGFARGIAGSGRSGRDGSPPGFQDNFSWDSI